jgi:superfamily II DNA or RNA helicase
VIERALLRGLKQPLEEPDLTRVKNLAWMVANDLLQIKIALPISPPGYGIFHEKLGLFFDSTDAQVSNIVAFSGSMNETADGLVSNYESIDVSISWDSSLRESSRVRDHIEHFENLWKGKIGELEVMDFPDAVERELIQTFSPGEQPSYEPGRKRILRPFQVEAVNAWEQSNFSGILSMATGSGKTFTALKCLDPYSDKLSLIIVPHRDLLLQWEGEIEEEYPEASILLVESGQREWERRLSQRISSLGSKRLFVVATIQSGIKQRFLDLISRVPSNRLAVVVDEVHHSGAPEFSRIFAINADLKLGLSATPYRMWDEEGNQRIFEYFGGEVFDYPISRAIAEGVLCPYRYHIHPIALTLTELDRFRAFSKSIAKLLQSTISQYPGLKGLELPSLIHRLDRINPKRANEIRALYLRRIVLVKTAVRKIDAVRQIVREFTDLKRCLVYCNDMSHVKEILSVLFEQGLEALEYTSAIDPKIRERLRVWLSEDSSSPRFLVAIRCLDEGADIPACDSAILVSSSRSEREFIQRRGRMLRIYPMKRVALIHDIVVLPFIEPENAYPLSDSELEFARAEIRRVKEFAKGAENAQEIDIGSIEGIYESVALKVA